MQNSFHGNVLCESLTSVLMYWDIFCMKFVNYFFLTHFLSRDSNVYFCMTMLIQVFETDTPRTTLSSQQQSYVADLSQSRCHLLVPSEPG